MNRSSVRRSLLLFGALIVANLVAGLLAPRRASAEESAFLPCNIEGNCRCIIVDPRFGYCSTNGAWPEPVCTKQDDCRVDPD